MRRALVAVTAALLATVTTPASAHPAYHYDGECAFDRAGLSGGPGVAYVAVWGTDPTLGTLVAVPIDVECHVYVNGVWHSVAVTASGFGAAAGATPWTYPGTPGDVHTLCTVVTVDGERHDACGGIDPPPGPPPVVWLVADHAVRTLNENVFQPADEHLCPLLASTTPGVPGVAHVTPEGDVYVAGVFVWDCPPYSG